MSSPLVWFLLVDSATGQPYKRTTVSSVLRSSLVVPVIDQFRKAVHLENASILTGIASSQLLVYKNKSSFDKRNAQDGNKEESLEEDLSIHTFGESKTDALVVVVPSTNQGVIPMEIDTSFDWELEISTVSQLIYVKESPLFELDSDYLAKTGLPSQKLVLYCRPAFHEQFKFLRERVINQKVLGWIVGPPGTGKSTTALAFASTLERNEWVISWIHLHRANAPVCVRLEGGSKKSRRIYPENERMLFNTLMEVDASKKHIVFLDGFALNGQRHVDILSICSYWLGKDRDNRRLVLVCSMSSRYRAKAHEDIILNEEKFDVYSWKEQEYLDAVKHSAFFAHVKSVLDTDLSLKKSIPPVDTEPSPQDLVRSKMYFAGSSARWMFFLQTKTIVAETNDSVAYLNDIIPYLISTIGDMSDQVINRLLSSSYDMSGRKVSIVSRFAGVMLAIKAGPDLIRRLAEATRHDGNPSMNGWMLEMWFFASLRNGGVKLFDDNDKVVQTWPETTVSTVDTASFPTLPEDKGVWMKPTKWNQGGFDAVYVDKSKKLVRFVQVTGADEHSFKLEYFYSFLLALSDCTVTEVVEIFFVVDQKKRSKFKLAEPSGQGLLTEFGWPKGKEKELVQTVYISGWNDQ